MHLRRGETIHDLDCKCASCEAGFTNANNYKETPMTDFYTIKTATNGFILESNPDHDYKYVKTIFTTWDELINFLSDKPVVSEPKSTVTIAQQS